MTAVPRQTGRQPSRRPSPAAEPARLSVVAGVRERLGGGHARTTARQFLQQPFASVQMLVLAAVGLLGFGVLMSVSTTISAASDNGGSGSIWAQGIKEALFVGLGLVIFWIAMRLSPRALRAFAYPLLALSVVSLLAVLIPGIGVGVYGARRWIDLGPLQLQPSELAKVAMLLWGADLLARKQQLKSLRQARHLFMPLVPGFALVSLLVMAEPDLGTTCCFMLILLGLLWMVGMPLRYFATMVGVIGAAVTLMAVAAPYRLQRLTSFTDPFKHARTSGYHTVEGLYALASGGVFGVGLGQGTSKYGWVPNANSDYVFAIIGEELGLIGCAVVLALFALLAYVGMRIARRSADPFVRLAAGTATIWLCGQAVINIGYVSGLLPVTGIPLPMISAGGTSLLATFFVLGMLTSFARHEPLAVNVARRSYRLNRRTRLERWARIPVPRPYAAPRRRTTTAPPRNVATTSRSATPSSRSATPSSRSATPSSRSATMSARSATATRRNPTTSAMGARAKRPRAANRQSA